MNSVFLIAVLLAPQADRPVRLPRVERLPAISIPVCNDANCKCGCNETGVCVCDEPKLTEVIQGEWVRLQNSYGDQYALISDGKQLGCWSVEWQRYGTFKNGKWIYTKTPLIPFKLPIKTIQPSVSFAPQIILSSPVCST